MTDAPSDGGSPDTRVAGTPPAEETAEVLARADVETFDDELPDRADVAVIGGGIAGASAAWHMARLGVDVVLVEKERVGGGATSAAVGVMSPPVRQPYHETVHDRGEEVARDLWDFATRSIRGLGEALREIGAADRVGLDLSGGIVLSERHTDHEVERSYQALDDAGIEVEWLDRDAVRERVGGRGFTCGYRLVGGGALSAAPAARALARGAADAGARIVEGVLVDEVERVEGGGLRLRCDDRELRTEMVVYATHVESRRFSDLLGDEIVPIRGQGLVLELDRPFPSGGSFATHWKLNVWRRAPGSDTTIFLGGWRHDAWDRAYWKMRPEIDERLQTDLATWFGHAFPELGTPTVTGRWSGIFGWTADYLPLVGPLPGTPAELVVGGFSGGGLPFAFESGRLVAHVVAGRDPVPGAAHFSPRRFL